MIGSIIGDIVGSIYEFDNIKTKSFDFWNKNCVFTDDTILTIAVAVSLLKGTNDINIFKTNLINVFDEFGNKYPDVGYGGRYLDWLENKNKKPYNSCGNGSAMRVSPIGWYAHTLEEAISLARASAEITHNHPEGIKGAKAVASAVFLAKNGSTKEEISNHINEHYYKIDFTIDEIRDTYDFESTCQNSVPQAFQAFFESTDFEDAIRNAISIGGDSDTIAAITGSIAEAYYGIDEDIQETALSYLDDFLADNVCEFFEKYIKKH